MQATTVGLGVSGYIGTYACLVELLVLVWLKYFVSIAGLTPLCYEVATCLQVLCNVVAKLPLYTCEAVQLQRVSQ